ncbi:MAG TPA: hypothetical protein VMT49_05715 [Steroidobacteraceae bacterium]|nr:hypothetical protein [Steroidobacteraceae bacterium]
MRALLISLVLANLLFFGWSYWIDRPEPGRGPTAGVAPLRLAAAAGAGAGANGTVPASGSAPAASAARCSSLGPLADEVIASVVGTALRARNYTPRERTVQSDVTDGYWVYIDNLRDAGAREQALKRLARAGVRDAAALADSGQVSVGLFSAQAGANLRAAAVRSAGLAPVIEARTHQVKEIWFDIDLGNGAPPPAVNSLVQGLNLATPPAWAACPAGAGAGAGAPAPVAAPATPATPPA